MEKLIIEGGRPLYGSLSVSGAKNAALPLLAATLLAPGEHVLTNVPDLRDTRTILSLLGELGATWRNEGSTYFIDSTNIVYSEVSYDLVKTMRASVLVLGPLLARLGRAKVSLPGGCAIGERPINFHIKGFERFGVHCRLENGYVEALIEGRLQGNSVYFDIPSVTGTENILMASAMADGSTIIKNAAREPEIGNLIDMLRNMGAEIEGRGSDQITIHGVDRLHAAKTEIIPDRIETGTYLLAVAGAGGETTINDCEPTHLPSLLDKLKETGADLSIGERSITISVDPQKRSQLKNVDIKTMPYPGFPTDLQAQFMALMSLGSGICVIKETIFENRFMHVAELRRMGASIRTEGNNAVVTGLGHDGLSGTRVMATDLRASSSLVVAGLAASGRTEISRIYHLERGYENMVGKLTGLGARVWKENE